MRQLLSWLVLAAITSLCRFAVASDIYLGFNVPTLLRAIAPSGPQEDPSKVIFPARWSSEGGPVMALYRVDRATSENVQLKEVSVAVMPTIELAILQMQRLRRQQKLRPVLRVDYEQAIPELGDEGWFYPHASEAKYGGVAFRRRNLVLHLTFEEQTPGSGIGLARQIDEQIQNNRGVTRLGSAAQAPTIEDGGIPTSLTVRRMMPVTSKGDPYYRNRSDAPPYAYVRINPRFNRVDDLDKLRLSLISDVARLEAEIRKPEYGPDEYVSVPDGPDRVRRVHASEADGRFIMEIRVPSERATHKFTLAALTEDNVVITKEIEVTIIPAE